MANVESGFFFIESKYKGKRPQDDERDQEIIFLVSFCLSHLTIG